MNDVSSAQGRTFAAVLARFRNNLSLPNEFESGDMAKFYFKRNLPERQSRIKASSLWKPHDCPSASKFVVTEIQSPLYKMVLMKAPYDIDVPGGFKAPFVISVSTTTQMQQLSADGWTRVLHCSYSANTEIPRGIRTGSDFESHSLAADVLREQFSDAPLLAPEEAPVQRVIPSNKSWLSTYFRGKRNLDFLNFWENGDSSYLPAKDWSTNMLKVVIFNIDTYKVICQAICILRHPTTNSDVMYMAFKTSYFRFHPLIINKALTLPVGGTWSKLAKETGVGPT